MDFKKVCIVCLLLLLLFSALFIFINISLLYNMAGVWGYTSMIFCEEFGRIWIVFYVLRMWY